MMWNMLKATMAELLVAAVALGIAVVMMNVPQAKRPTGLGFAAAAEPVATHVDWAGNNFDCSIMI